MKEEVYTRRSQNECDPNQNNLATARSMKYFKRDVRIENKRFSNENTFGFSLFLFIVRTLIKNLKKKICTNVQYYLLERMFEYFVNIFSKK